MNKVMLIGRLGRDPELRYSQAGIPMTNLRIATDETYTDRDGNKVERTEWHTVVVFQRQAENCVNYLRKGSLVFVEGSLQTRKWKDQGQERYITEIKAARVQFLDRKGSQPEKPETYSNRKYSKSHLYELSDALSGCEDSFGRIYLEDGVYLDEL